MTRQYDDTVQVLDRGGDALQFRLIITRAAKKLRRPPFAQSR